MARAAELGRAVRRRVSPNPGVGCVLVTVDGRVFEGATEPPGQRHAEIVALDAARAAGIDTANASVWVTLEPCAHTGRTGPCAAALVEAGVSYVAVALIDPDPHVTELGVARLRDAGIEVVVGPGRDVVAHDLRAYLTHRVLRRPWVTLKLGMTIDGRTVSDDPTTQWITGPAARADGHRLRAEHDAILVGANTVRVDNPRLTTRDAEGPDPLRVVLGHAPPDAAVHPCLEYTGLIGDALRDLANRGVLSVLVEGGARVANEFHAARLVDEYVFYVADSRPWDAKQAVARLWGIDVVDAVEIGNDARVIATRGSS